MFFLFFFFCDTLSLDVCVFTFVQFYYLKYLGFIEHFYKLLPLCLSQDLGLGFFFFFSFLCVSLVVALLDVGQHNYFGL